MHGARRQRRAQLLVAEQPREQRAEARLVDLAGEVLEEAVELVEVAVGGGEEPRRVGVRRVRAHDARTSACSSSRKRSTRPRRADEVAAVEAAREEVGVAEHASRERARPVAQLEARYGDPVRAIRRSLRVQAKTPSTSPARSVATLPTGRLGAVRAGRVGRGTRA